MKLNKSVETMTRRKRSHDPDFRISSERILKLWGREYNFHLDLWFSTKSLKSGESK
tara:strand:+ start:938 stop:1105 length:168 start_codon:yes stop_codon:yes gene_type:complete